MGEATPEDRLHAMATSEQPTAASPSKSPPQPLDLGPQPSKLGDLKIVVLRAHGLSPADKGGHSDPYAVLTVRTGKGLRRQHQHRTSTAKKTLNPQWNAAFSVHEVFNFDSQASVTIFDEDLGSKFDSDDPLGQVGLSLRKLASAGLPRDGTMVELPPIPLRPSKRQNLKAQGTIELAVGWVYAPPVRFHVKDKGSHAIIEAAGTVCRGEGKGFAWSASCGEPIGSDRSAFFKQRVDFSVHRDVDEYSAAVGVMSDRADRDELLGFLQQGSISLLSTGTLFVDGKRERTVRGFADGDRVSLSVERVSEADPPALVFSVNGEEVYRRDGAPAGWRFAVGGYSDFSSFRIVDVVPRQ
jgi:hypothetical protein